MSEETKSAALVSIQTVSDIDAEIARLNGEREKMAADIRKLKRIRRVLTGGDSAEPDGGSVKEA
jgi:hypothetical protein